MPVRTPFRRKEGRKGGLKEGGIEGREDCRKGGLKDCRIEGLKE
jgi:hypothetical protein